MPIRPPHSHSHFQCHCQSSTFPTTPSFLAGQSAYSNFRLDVCSWHKSDWVALLGWSKQINGKVGLLGNELALDLQEGGGHGVISMTTRIRLLAPGAAWRCSASLPVRTTPVALANSRPADNSRSLMLLALDSMFCNPARFLPFVHDSRSDLVGSTDKLSPFVRLWASWLPPSGPYHILARRAFGLGSNSLLLESTICGDAPRCSIQKWRTCFSRAR